MFKTLKRSWKQGKTQDSINIAQKNLEEKYKNEKYTHWHLKSGQSKGRLSIVEERTTELKDLENYLNAADREKEMEIMKESLRDVESRVRKTKLVSEFFKESNR